MLIGEYTHTLDDKNRLMLPKAFKADLGSKVVLTRGLDNCLFIFSSKQWKETASRLGELSFATADTRGFSRFMLAGAFEVSTDKSGRVLVPDSLKEFATLKSKVVVAGVLDRVEIWDESVWNAYSADIQKKADAMAEKLSEVGAL